MSYASAQAFLARLETDAEFREAISHAKSPEAKQALVQDSGYDFTVEELNQAMSHEDTSDEAKEHALDAVSNVAPEGIEPNAVGMWFFAMED